MPHTSSTATADITSAWRCETITLVVTNTVQSRSGEGLQQHIPHHESLGDIPCLQQRAILVPSGGYSMHSPGSLGGHPLEVLAQLSNFNGSHRPGKHLSHH